MSDKTFIDYIVEGSNNPIEGKIEFNSSDHLRYQNGQCVNGHNYNCHRRVVIEKNIEGDEGYTISILNLDGIHPIWQNNIQMAPKRMRIISVQDNIIVLRGYGNDRLGASFADYGIALLFSNHEIERIQLDMYDRHLSIVYLR